MSVNEFTTAESSSSTSTDLGTPSLASIGIEFEYPLAGNQDSLPVPAGQASASSAVRDNYGRGTGWLTDDPDDEYGYVGRDHVGAEITSGILDLHDGSPEEWYRNSIEQLENDGYPFAATGYGATTFGLHMHISQVNESQREFIREISGENWFRVFICASVDPHSADPWRHGGVRSPGGSRTLVEHTRGERNHYEWRLPEPMLADHFEMVMEFLRMVAHEQFEGAEDYARELVLSKDERLTAVQQYEILDEEIPAWPHNGALSSSSTTNVDAARWFHDLMQSD